MTTSAATEQDYGPVKEFLESAIEAKVEAARLKRRVAELESRCQKMTAQMKDVPGGGRADNQALWVLLAEEIEREKAAHRGALEQYRTVETFIAHLSKPVHRALLRLRYLEGLGWVKVQQELYKQGIFYSERHISRLHAYALEEARALWRKGGPWENELTENEENEHET